MKWKILISAVLVVLLVGSGIGIYIFNQRDVGDLIERGEKINLLVLGVDHVEGSQARRSDAMMVVSIDPVNENVNLISIPRDLFLKYPDGNFRRVNAANAIGGASLATKMVSDFLGAPIDFHMVIDYEGFKEIVDLMGGIQLTVEERLQYTDEAAGLEIDIEPGTQTLSGEEAMGYVRYRAGQSDFQRIGRQQKFLQALLEKGIQFEDWSQVRSLIDAGRNYTETNLSLMDMYDLGQTVRGLGVDDFEMVTLSGDPARIEGKEVLLPRIVETRQVVARGIHGVNFTDRSDVRVYILNGEGSAFLARQSADRLSGLGFSVTGSDNADRFDYERSYIVILNERGRELSNLLSEELDFEHEIVEAENFQENMASLEAAGVQPEGNLLLIMGEGSTDFAL